jgi:5-carboxymethyl-2-hydroxymuconate isomerase
MPHCVIEHSSDIDGAVLIAPVFNGALASDLFDASGKDIKVRTVCFEHYPIKIS